MNSRKILSVSFLALVVICALAFYWETNLPSVSAGTPAMPIGKPVEIKAPLGLPPVPIPPDNPPTAETIALGRRLYYDPGLSADGTVSCATCHAPDLSFRDGKALSNGVAGQL